MECHVTSCPAQKLLNNRRHKSEITIKSPFVANNSTTVCQEATKEERRKDTHRSVTASTINHQKLTHGCTSLMYACQRGDASSIIKELRNKPSSLRIRDRSNKTALHYCSGQENLVAAASVAMAAPELMESADEDGLTPLHMAVIQGNLNLVNLLLANKSDVNALDSEGHSVVHWATVCGEIEALRAVLMAGADVSTPDINGGSPLHYAAQMCGASYDDKTRQSSSKLALEILSILLKHPKSSVDVADKDGRQPLLWAASAGSESAVLALIKAGSRVESCDKDGLTALHCAASRGHTGCIDTIIGLCGAPTDLIDSNGCTALHYAVTLGHADATSLLLAKEADPNRQDRKGRTPAHCGCAKGQFETVKILHSHKANLWLRNARGDLPVHEAASSGRRELVQWLLEQRPKQVNTSSNDGRSLLHTAAANDNTEMCKMLIDFGADVNSIHRTMRNIVLTPLDCALQKGHRSTAKFLQLHGGLPAGKLRLAARNNMASAVNDQELVQPLKFDDSRSTVPNTRDSSASGKTGEYVVYVKRSDSESSCEMKGRSKKRDTSCSHHQRKKKQTNRHDKCHGGRKRDKSKERRRTSSCSDTFLVEKDQDKDSDVAEKEMNRCKSNLEIRRRNKSKETCCPGSRSSSNSSSASESDTSDGNVDESVDCCKHRKWSKKKHNKNCRRYTVSVRKEQQQQQKGKSSSGNKSQSHSRDNSRGRTGGGVEMCDKDTQSVDIPYDEQQQKLQSTNDAAKSSPDNKSLPRPTSSSSVNSVKKRPQSARVSSAKRQQQNAQLEEQEFDNDLAQIEKEFVPEKVVSLNDILDNEPASELLSLVNEQEGDASAKSNKSMATRKGEAAAGAENAPGTTISHKKPDGDEEGAESDGTFTMEQDRDKSTATMSSPQQQPKTEKKVGTVTFPEETSSYGQEEEDSVTAAAVQKEQSQGNEICHPQVEDGEAGVASDEGKIQRDASQKENSNKPQTPVDPEPSPQLPAAPPATPDTKGQQQPLLHRQLSSSQGSLSRRGQGKGNSSSSFAVLPSEDNVQGGGGVSTPTSQSPSRSSFKVMSGNSTENVKSVSISERPTSFKVLADNRFQPDQTSISTDDELPVGTGVGGGGGEEDRRMRRLKKRNKSRDAPSLDRSQEERKSPVVAATSSTPAERAFQLSRDQDSGFEPSPRATKSKIPRAINHDQDDLDGRNSRRDGFIILDEKVKGTPTRTASEGRKPGDKNACNMAVVNASIQKNIRRYYMERKIFQHLLELKSLQIRSSRVNEAVLVKRAVDDYHKSVQALGYETGGTLRRYAQKEYTFKNFEIFLYETLKGLQKHGTHNFQNISDVYKEAERRLSPDYKQYEKALQCTTKTHRCLHAAHAYTGIPCAAYIPMMNHHTIPKLGFGPYKNGSVGSFYLPKILTGSGGGGKCGGNKVSLELSQGNSKQLIPLPADKLDSNKRYYVTFTVKSGGGSVAASDAGQQQQTPVKESKKVLPLN